MSLITKSSDQDYGEYILNTDTWKTNKAAKLCRLLGYNPDSWRIKSGNIWYITVKQETPEHKLFYRRLALTLIL